MVYGGANVVGAPIVGARIEDPSQQPGNIYYVDPSDGPCSVYAIPILTHSN